MKNDREVTALFEAALGLATPVVVSTRDSLDQWETLLLEVTHRDVPLAAPA